MLGGIVEMDSELQGHRVETAKCGQKRIGRDHLVVLKWNQSPPAPRLPAEVISRTQEKYLAALRNLLG